MPLNTAVISFGSNINPEANILKAKEILGQRYSIIRESSFTYTRPIGLTNQPDFLNGAVLIQTDLTSDLLKKSLTEIENTLGRDRTTPKFGPRTIDLDIVVWNNQVIDQDFYLRPFLRDAVLEILPDLIY